MWDRETSTGIPRFASLDLQVTKEIRLPGFGKKAKVGFGVFNLLNHFDPRDVQNNLDSYRFGVILQLGAADVQRKVRTGLLKEDKWNA